MIISRSQNFCTKSLTEIYLTFAILIGGPWNFQGKKLGPLATRVTFFQFSRFLHSFWDISVFIDKGTLSKNFQCPKMTLKKSKSKIHEFVPNLCVKTYLHVKFHDPRLIGVACSSVTTFFGFFSDQTYSNVDLSTFNKQSDSTIFQLQKFIVRDLLNLARQNSHTK